MRWIPLTSISQFSTLLSSNEEFAVFKHSTRCSISSMAMSRLERSWPISEEDMPVYYLDVLQFRDVSNHIANVTGVQHESPQLLVFKSGEVAYAASHISISAEAALAAI